MRPKPAHQVQEDFDFLIELNIILFILYTTETFLKVIVFLFLLLLQFWGVQFFFFFFLVSVTALSCFCCIFCALSWTFMSRPVSRGVCSQFV